MGTISIGTGISNGDGISLSMGGDYGIGYGDIVSLPDAITRYFIDLDPVLNSYYQLTVPFVAVGNFNIPFEFSTADTVSTMTIMGESAAGLNEIYIAAGVLKVEINAVEHKFSTAPAVADGKLHSGVIVRVGTTITLILDGVTYAEDIVTPSTGSFTMDVYGQSNGTEFFNGILANIDGDELGLATGNVEGNVTYVNIPESNRELYTLIDGDWIGAELVVNGGFATDTDWIKGAGWSIATGEAHALEVVATSWLQQSVAIGMEAGESYLFKIHITSITVGDVRFSVFDGAGGGSPDFSTVGIHDFIYTAIRENDVFIVRRGAIDLTGSVDDVSVKRIIEVA